MRASIFLNILRVCLVKMATVEFNSKNGPHKAPLLFFSSIKHENGTVPIDYAPMKFSVAMEKKLIAEKILNPSEQTYPQLHMMVNSVDPSVPLSYTKIGFVVVPDSVRSTFGFNFAKSLGINVISFAVKFKVNDENGRPMTHFRAQLSMYDSKDLTMYEGYLYIYLDQDAESILGTDLMSVLKSDKGKTIFDILVEATKEDSKDQEVQVKVVEHVY